MHPTLRVYRTLSPYHTASEFPMSIRLVLDLLLLEVWKITTVEYVVGRQEGDKCWKSFCQEKIRIHLVGQDRSFRISPIEIRGLLLIISWDSNYSKIQNSDRQNRKRKEKIPRDDWGDCTFRANVMNLSQIHDMNHLMFIQKR